MTIAQEGPEDRRGGEGLVRSLRSLFAEEAQASSAAVADSEGFRERIGAFLAAAPEMQREMLEPLEQEGAELRRANVLEPLVDAVLELTVTGRSVEESDAVGGTGGPPLALARKLATPGVATMVALRLGGDRDLDRRRGLAEVAKRLPEAMAPALAEALQDMPDRGARRACLDALAALGPKARAEAEQMLDDSRWFIVRNGVQLLAEMGSEDAVAQITGALGHEDSRVRRESVLAVARLGGEDAGMLLLGMLEDGDVDVRTSAVMGVAALQVERAVRPLLQLLEEGGDEDLQVEVLRALGRLKDPGAVPALEKRARGSLFSRPAKAVRIAAYRALSAIGTPHALGVLREGAEDRDPEIRRVARSLLPPAGEESD